MPVGISNGKFFEDDFDAVLDGWKRPSAEQMRDAMEIDPSTNEAPVFDPMLTEARFQNVADKRSVWDVLTGADGKERYITWPEQMVRDVATAATAPGRVIKEGTSTDELIKPMADLAGTAVLGPAPIAKKVADGTLGSFAGVKSKTVDTEKLNTARAMDRKAATPRDIWEETGFWKGRDGQWRYELDSSQMKFRLPKDLEDYTINDLITMGGEVRGKLPEFLDYPEFYKAYPKAKDIEFVLNPELPGIGRFNINQNIIEINPKSMEDMMARTGATYEGVFAHELQHLIQQAEGWPGRGSNPSHAMDQWDSALAGRIYEESMAGNQAKVNELSNLRNELHLADDPRIHLSPDGTPTPKSGEFSKYMYRRDPGEIEAEVVRHRQGIPMPDRTTMPEEHVKILEHYGLLPQGGEFRYPFHKEDALKHVDMAGPTDVPFPKDYLDKVPQEMRLSRKGVSHPGFRWEVWDPQTGKIMRKGLETRSGASKSMDRLDNQYGAYRYRVRRVAATKDQLTEDELKFLKDNDIRIQSYEGD